MITLKSHAIPASPHNTPTIRYYGGKPETTVVGETYGTRDMQPHERMHLRRGSWTHCVMCHHVTGRDAPWMDNIDRWQEHPMRCR